MNRSNKSLKLFFVVSLLVNLLLAGVIIGHVWWHVSGHWGNGVSELTQALPVEKQQMLTSAIQKIRKDTQSLHDQISIARDDAAKLLKADPFDGAVYLDAVKHIQDLRAQMSLKVSGDLAEVAQKFTPPEREVLANITRNMCFSGNPGNKPDCQKMDPEPKKFN